MRFLGMKLVTTFLIAVSILTSARALQAGSTITRTATTSRANVDDALLELVETAITKTSRRYLDVDRHTPWQIMHGLLAYRNNYLLKSGDGHVNAIEWITNGARYRGTHWFEVTQYGGRAHPFTVPYAFEGHVNQFTAILSMSNLPTDHPIKVAGGRTITVADLVRHAKMSVSTKEELTWTLWFLTHYVEPDAEWVNQQNQQWSMEYLVRIQTRSSVTRAPCGGTHNLFALAYARNAYLRKHGQLHGAWLEADQKLKQHIAAAKALQNADGTFSTEFFKGRGFSYDFNERIKSSGHMLEWLMMALPSNRLDEEWVKRAVKAVANDLVTNSSQPAECGPLYHAVHSLVLYRDRVAPPAPAELASTIDDAAEGETLKTLQDTEEDGQPTQPTVTMSAPEVEEPAEPENAPANEIEMLSAEDIPPPPPQPELLPRGSGPRF
ncbi:hypothetical protein Mal4_17520 [Maioricimonas rarisocia]|uniref:Prenyltransferase and squalene oxidase repeat protein n=1 Tax=Maioricimonas rarisocia TaxID=2528026 RepID=A0A517Z4N4_9PLAN|nr:hypothetical protein [Maioricimonas rarisocia]QDU37440.1 hypothetical protein Mal4_17520 [Maioricimonas rarisocia]